MHNIRYLPVIVGCLLLCACAVQVRPVLGNIQVKACPEPAAAVQCAVQADMAPRPLTRQGASDASNPVFSDVELQRQTPELPNGCEVTSLAMLLTAAGYPVDKVTLYEQYLPTESFQILETGRVGPSPEAAYAGDAASTTGGWYCFEGPVLAAGNAWLNTNGGLVAMRDLTGLTQAELDALLTAGVPVVAWVTRGYTQPLYAGYFSWILPDGTVYVPYDNLHCVVVTAKSADQYQIADPLAGWQSVSAQMFWDSFSSMGCRAVTVGPALI